MRKIILVALAAVLGSVCLNAQTYAIGQSTCSKTAGIYCYGIPLNLAGQPQANVWLYENAISGPGWLDFGEGLSNLGQATINQDASYHPTYGTVTATHNGITKTSSQITSLSLTYYGTDPSGNAYNGAMTISFDYYYVWVCAPRSPGCGWHRRVTGGSTTYAIAYYSPVAPGAASPIAPTPTSLPPG